jgi:NDP-sugar pyrophosphorylase family protein
MAVHRVPDVGRFGALRIEHDRVTGFDEKAATGAGAINAVVYLCSHDVRAAFVMPESFSFEHDFIAARLRELKPLAWPAAGTFIDIGVPEDLERAHRLFGTPNDHH